MNRRTFTSAIAASVASLVASFSFGGKKEPPWTIDHEKGVVRFRDPLVLWRNWVDFGTAKDGMVRVVQEGEVSGLGYRVAHVLYPSAGGVEMVHSYKRCPGGHTSWRYESVVPVAIANALPRHPFPHSVACFVPRREAVNESLEATRWLKEHTKAQFIEHVVETPNGRMISLSRNPSYTPKG